MLNKFFKLDENNTDLKTELLAGLMPATGVFFATALASGVSCIIMGLISKYPVGLAPGMGMNALFTYTIILTMGNTWETALAAVFVSSIIFLLITISGLREAILNALPFDLKLAIGAGIGFFLAFIGLKGAGIIVADPATLVGMGSILSAPALLAVIGILLTLILYIKKVPAAVFLGLVITAILGVIFTLAGFGAGDPIMPAIPAEFISFSFDTSVVGAFATGFTQLFSNIPNLIMILFSLLFVTFFDTTGTLIPLANQCGFVDEEGNADGIDRAFLGDAISGIIGAILGTSTYLCSYCFSIVYFFCNCCSISNCRYLNDRTIKRSGLGQHGCSCFRIHDNHHDAFNLLHFLRYRMGIRHLRNCIHCYR